MVVNIKNYLKLVPIITRSGAIKPKLTLVLGFFDDAGLAQLLSQLFG